MSQAVFNPMTQQLDFIAPAGGIAPADAQYWIATANTTLTAEKNLGLLTTGLVKNTVSGAVGTPSTAVLGTDYIDPTYISDTAYAASWNGVTTIAPSKNAVYDKIELVQGDVDGFPDELKNLTTAEIQQIENIGTEAISATEWGYLAALDQSLTTASSVQFSQVTANLVGNVTGNVSGSSGSCTGNALTATTLQTARDINGVSFNGSANITVTAALPDTEVTGATVALVGNNEYRMNRGTLITATLPSSCAAGQTILLAGYGAGGFLIAQNASQIIHYGNLDTTTGTGGSVASANRYDSITLKCVVTDLEFVVIASQGTLTVV